MSFTPGNRPASVTVDPETVVGSPKTPFPGARPAAVTVDPQRDQAATASRPATNATVAFDPYEVASTSFSHNTELGGEYVHSTVTGVPVTPVVNANPPVSGQKTPFPGSRPATVTVDGQRDGTSGSKTAPFIPVAGTEDPEHHYVGS